MNSERSLSELYEDEARSQKIFSGSMHVISGILAVESVANYFLAHGNITAFTILPAIGSIAFQGVRVGVAKMHNTTQDLILNREFLNSDN